MLQIKWLKKTRSINLLIFKEEYRKAGRWLSKNKYAMKNFLTLIILTFTFSSFATENIEYINLDFSKKKSQARKKEINYAEVVIDAITGKKIYALNENAIIHPASLTKLITASLIFDELEQKKINLKTKLTISKKARKAPPSKLYLANYITVEEAIKALIIKSANDVSIVLAEHLSTSEWGFTELMNKQAKKMGMFNTNFRNASGLHHDDQFSTITDIAKMAYYIKNNYNKYFYLFGLSNFQYNKKTYYGHNHLLKESSVTGMKTGYTSNSGYNIITTAHKKNKSIIAIIIGAKSAKKRDKRMKEILKEFL